MVNIPVGVSSRTDDTTLFAMRWMIYATNCTTNTISILWFTVSIIHLFPTNSYMDVGWLPGIYLTWLTTTMIWVNQFPSIVLQRNGQCPIDQGYHIRVQPAQTQGFSSNIDSMDDIIEFLMKHRWYWLNYLALIIVLANMVIERLSTRALINFLLCWGFIYADFTQPFGVTSLTQM